MANQCTYTHEVEGITQEEWQCPHEAHDQGLCVFHLPVEEMPAPETVGRAFREAVNEGRPEFVGATFGDLRLNGTRLDAGDAGPIRLEFVTVEGDVDLNDATLDTDLIASSLTVGGAVRCRRTTFREVQISHAAFAGPVETIDARFRRPVSMGRDVSFERGARFDGATFDSKLHVRGAVFGDDVSLADVTFDNAVTVERVLVQGGLSFEGAHVAGLSCSRVEAESLSLDAIAAEDDAEMTVEGCDLGRLTLREVTVPGAVVIAGNDLDRSIEAARADLSGASVRNADLRSADLGRATLVGTTFRNTDFSGATLAGTDLSNADLAGARLHGTDLRGARLADASLRGASLDGATLDGATLDGADLQRVAFGTASFYRASFEDCRLDRATTFARYNHYDPAAVQADGSVATSGENTLDRLDRAINVHRRTHALIREATGGQGQDDHDRRALRLRMSWCWGHATSGATNGNEREDADTGPSRSIAALGVVGFALAFALVTLGESFRALAGMAVATVAGFAVAYPAVGGLVVGGADYTGWKGLSVSLVRGTVSLSVEQFVEGVVRPVWFVAGAFGSVDPVDGLVTTGVEPTGRGITLAVAEAGIGSILAVVVALALVGHGLRYLWNRGV